MKLSRIFINESMIFLLLTEKQNLLIPGMAQPTVQIQTLTEAGLCICSSLFTIKSSEQHIDINNYFVQRFVEIGPSVPNDHNSRFYIVQTSNNPPMSESLF